MSTIVVVPIGSETFEAFSDCMPRTIVLIVEACLDPPTMNEITVQNCTGVRRKLLITTPNQVMRLSRASQRVPRLLSRAHQPIIRKTMIAVIGEDITRLYRLRGICL